MLSFNVFAQQKSNISFKVADDAQSIKFRIKLKSNFDQQAIQLLEKRCEQFLLKDNVYEIEQSVDAGRLVLVTSTNITVREIVSFCDASKLDVKCSVTDEDITSAVKSKLLEISRQ